MKYIKTYTEKLNELKVYNFDDYEYSDDYDTIIYHKGDLFIFDCDRWEEVSVEILNKLNDKGVDIHYIDEDFFSPHDFEDNITIVIGMVYDNELILSGDTDYRQSINSVDIKKIIKTLNLNGVKVRSTDYDGEEEYLNLTDDYNEDKLFYHGTCVKFLESINKKGITPNDVSNFGEIKTNGMVFLTSNYEKAVWHSKKAGIVNGSFPCVIELEVPDKSKMVVDYDLANKYYSDDKKISDIGYKPNKNRFKSFYPNTERDISNKIGVFGYKGRIPSSHIVGMRVDLDSFREWNEFGEAIFDENLMFTELNDMSYWNSISITEFLNNFIN